MSRPVMAAAIHASPEAKKTGAFPDWVLLAQFGRVYCYDDKDAAAAAVEYDATAVAVDTTNDKSGYFSFTLRPAPSVSYVDLHWPYGIPKSIFELPATPIVLSADGHLVLLRIVIRRLPYLHREPDMFVYTAGTSSPPSLRRLPACTVMARGFASSPRFLTVHTNVAILCRGGDQDDYLVADLLVSWKAGGDPCGIKPSPVFAVLCVFSSKTGEWMTCEMDAPQPQGQGQGQFPYLWLSSTAFPFAGRFICWVDYYSGVLLADLSKDNSPVLYYIPFPGKQYPDDDEERVDRGCPEAFRNVSTTQDKMQFVQIGNGWRETSGCRCQQNDETMITVWMLNTTGQYFVWEMQCVIKLNGLWADHSYQAQGLPHVPPEFPVVAKDDPSVLYCILREGGFYGIGKVWMIMLDLKNASFRSCVPYINEQIVCCFEGGMDTTGFWNVPFLPSDFSKHLNKQPGQIGDENKLN